MITLYFKLNFPPIYHSQEDQLKVRILFYEVQPYIYNCNRSIHKDEHVSKWVTLKYKYFYKHIEPAKATGSMISPLSVRMFVCSSVCNELISETARTIFSETRHEVGGQ